jgi:Tfp pilus assembly protein PilV
MGVRATIGSMGRRLREREDGFTIIEVLVAALILVLGSLAVFMTFAAAIHNVQRSKETQVGLSVAQREMEKIRILPYDQIGLEPTVFQPTTDPKNPVSRVENGDTEFIVKRGGTALEPLILGGEVPAGPDERSSPDGTRVTVYRFVTEQSADVKRVVIDVVPVTPPDATYQPNYYELQSFIVNPEPGG